MSANKRESTPFLSPDSARKYLSMMRGFYDSHTKQNNGYQDINGSQYYGTLSNFGSEILIESRKLLMNNPDLDSVLKASSDFKKYFRFEYSDFIQNVKQQNMIACILKKEALLEDKYEYSIHMPYVLKVRYLRSDAYGEMNVKNRQWLKSVYTPTLVIHAKEDGDDHTSDVSIPLTIDAEDVSYFFNVDPSTADIIHTPSSSDGEYGTYYEQTTPSTEWVVPHHSGKDPYVDVIDTDGVLVQDGYTVESTMDTVTITFDTATTGAVSITPSDKDFGYGSYSGINVGVATGFRWGFPIHTDMIDSGEQPVRKVVSYTQTDEYWWTNVETTLESGVALLYRTYRYYSKDTIIDVNEKLDGVPLLFLRTPELDTIPELDLDNNIDIGGRPLLAPGCDGQNHFHLYPCSVESNITWTTENRDGLETYDHWFIVAECENGSLRYDPNGDEPDVRFTAALSKIRYVNIASDEWDPDMTPIRNVDMLCGNQYSKISLRDTIINDEHVWQFYENDLGITYAVCKLNLFAPNAVITEDHDVTPAFDLVYNFNYRNPLENYCRNAYSGIHVDSISVNMGNGIDKRNGVIHDIGEFDGLPPYMNYSLDDTSHHIHTDLYAIREDSNFRNQSIYEKQTAAIILDSGLPTKQISGGTLSPTIVWKDGDPGYFEYIGPTDVKMVNYLSDIVYVDDNTFATVQHPDYSECPRFIYHGNGRFSLNQIGFDPVLESGRGFLVTNDPARYENNDATFYQKPGRTIARNCDIPTSFLEIGSVAGVSPSLVIDKDYVRMEASFTEADLLKMWVTKRPYVVADVAKFIGPDKFYGDIDGDGAITLYDATYCQMIASEYPGRQFTPEQVDLADINRDMRVDTRDVYEILQRASNDPYYHRTVPHHVKFVFDADDDMDAIIDDIRKDYFYTNIINTYVDVFDENVGTFNIGSDGTHPIQGYVVGDGFTFNIGGVYYEGTVTEVDAAGAVIDISINEPISGDPDRLVNIANFDGVNNTLNTAGGSGTGLLITFNFVSEAVYNSYLRQRSGIIDMTAFKLDKAGFVWAWEYYEGSWHCGNFDMVLGEDPDYDSKLVDPMLRSKHDVFLHNVLSTTYVSDMSVVDTHFTDRLDEEPDMDIFKDINSQDSLFIRLPSRTILGVVKKRVYRFEQGKLNPLSVYGNANIDIVPRYNNIDITEGERKEIKYNFTEGKQPEVYIFNPVARKKHEWKADISASYYTTDNEKQISLTEILSQTVEDVTGNNTSLYSPAQGGKMILHDVYQYSTSERTSAFKEYRDMVYGLSRIELEEKIIEEYGESCSIMRELRSGVVHSDREIIGYLLMNFYDARRGEIQKCMDAGTIFEGESGEQLAGFYGKRYVNCYRSRMTQNVVVNGSSVQRTPTFIFRIAETIPEADILSGDFRMYDEAGKDISEYTILINDYKIYTFSNNGWKRVVTHREDDVS